VQVLEAADRVWPAAQAARCGSAKIGAVNSVGNKLGAIALHAMPSADQASAMARVSYATPPLEAP
jgi:hypothetical protein